MNPKIDLEYRLGEVEAKALSKFQVCFRTSPFCFIKPLKYVNKAIEAKELIKEFTNIKLEWIPREENEICDELTESIILKKE